MDLFPMNAEMGIIFTVKGVFSILWSDNKDFRHIISIAKVETVSTTEKTKDIEIM